MRKKYDFLFIVPRDGILGGAEQLVLNLVDYLDVNGYNCRVICIQKKTYGHWEPYEDRIKVSYSPFPKVYLGYIYFLFKIPFLTLREKYTRAFASQTLVNAMLGILKQLGVLRNVKLIVRESNSIFHLLKGKKLKLYSIAYRIGYHKVNLLICQTEFMKDQLLKAMPWMKKKLNIIVFSNPINLDHVKDKAQVKFDKLEGRKYLVAAGRLVPAKGFDILIDSFSYLSPDYPDLELMILGAGQDKSSLQKQIDDLGLSDKVILEGMVTNVYPYFKQATACVLSSRIEGFPNVLLQMMSQNEKVVSTLSAGGIDKQEGVFTCITEDPYALEKAIRSCLDSETSQNRKLFDDNLNNRTVKSFVQNIIVNTPISKKPS